MLAKGTRRICLGLVPLGDGDLFVTRKPGSILTRAFVFLSHSSVSWLN